MTSATDELRRMLDERGMEWTYGDGTVSFSDGKHWCHAWAYNDDTMCVSMGYFTPEQAIAATLGSELPYDELLRCLENDWNISASWDGLRKFWCIELTEEGVKLRNSAHVTLTAEQVRDVIEVAKAELLESCKYLGDYEQRTNDVLKAFGKMEQEIAATLGSGTCKVESMHGYTDAHTHTSWCVVLSCHTLDAWEDSIPPSYCPICGRKVVDDG